MAKVTTLPTKKPRKLSRLVVMNPNTQVCKTCGKDKPLSEYGYRKGGKYIRLHCKPCYCNKLRAWRYSKYFEVGGVSRSAVRLGRRYGMTAEEYIDLFEKQEGLCAICQKPPREKILAVDHNHATGTVRELLCRRCNSAIGFAEDNPEVLRAMATYIEKHHE